MWPEQLSEHPARCGSQRVVATRGIVVVHEAHLKDLVVVVRARRVDVVLVREHLPELGHGLPAAAAPLPVLLTRSAFQQAHRQPCRCTAGTPPVDMAVALFVAVSSVQGSGTAGTGGHSPEGGATQRSNSPATLPEEVAHHRV